MYFLVVGAFLFVCPLVSIAVEAVARGGTPTMALVGRWFVFWGVGVRLFTAGLRQVLQPRWTAETILGLRDPASFFVVRELGFANLALGAVGVGSLVATRWVTPAAVAGAIFYGLAGVNHVGAHERNRLQNVALVSDLFIAALLAAYCAAVAAG